MQDQPTTDAQPQASNVDVTPAAPNPIVEHAKKALMAAFVILLLCVPMIAFRTVDTPDGSLGLETRWPLVGALIGIGGIAYFLWSMITSQRGSSTIGSALAPIGNVMSSALPFAGAGLLVFAVVLPFLPFSDRYVMDLAILVLTYVMLAWGLNIVVGLAGLLDLGYVAFYAVGAYSYALLAQYYGFSFWICLPLAGILDAFW